MNSRLDELLQGGAGPVPPKGLVILGATGDMVSKRESRDALAYLAQHQLLKLPGNPILLAGSHVVRGRDYFRDFCQGDSASNPLEASALNRFETLAGLNVAGMSLPAVDVSSSGDLAALELPRPRNLLYAALPPRLYLALLENLHRTGLLQGQRSIDTILLEKPFGTDLADARKLHALIQKHREQREVLLIDHFLAYPGTLNMLALRAQAEMEVALQPEFLDRLELILSEKIQSNDRPYFRETGSVVDMVQSHALLLLASFALETPAAWSADALQAARLQLLKRLELHPETARWGQFAGFNDPRHGAPRGAAPSNAETFVAFDFRLSHPRWSYVPCRLLNGKGVSEDFFGLKITFRKLPAPLARKFRLVPNQRTVLRIEVRHGHISWEQQGKLQKLPMDPRIQPRPPHALLLPAALRGQRGLFVSAAEALCCWEFTEKLLSALQGRRRIGYALGSKLEEICG